MSPLHYQTRRLFCRTAFCALCLLPTAGVVVWGAWRRLPTYAAGCCAALEHELGLSVRAAAVRYPRPGVVEFEEFALADPETGEVLLNCRRLQGRRTLDEWHVTLVALQIEPSALPRLQRAVERWLAERAGQQPPQVWLSAADAVWGDGKGGLTVTGIEGRLGMTEAGPQATLAFRPADSPAGPAARCTVTRNRTQTAPATEWELDTGGGWWPCQVVRGVAPWVVRLGSDARFRGYLWWRDAGDGRRLACSGELAGVELRQLADAARLDLQGQARVALERLDVRDGRIIDLAAGIDTGPGTINRRGAMRVADALALGWRRSEAALPDTVPFSRLACRVRLNARGFWLFGDGPDGALLLDDGPRATLVEPARQPQSPLALVDLLAPGGQEFVPATPASAAVLSWLPLGESTGDERR
jgi:hypothetical protein